MPRKVPPEFAVRVRLIAGNRIDGAHVLAQRAADAIAALTREDDLQRCADLLRAAQPSMAPLVYVAELLSNSSDPARTAREFRKALDSANARIAEHALALIPHSAAILIHSASATVECALRTAHDRGRKLEIFATESLPGGEGRTIAAALLDYGIAAEVVSDRDVSDLATRVALAFTGADWISPSDVTNKVGTAELCRAARAAGTPVYCLASRLKFLPFGPPADPSGIFGPVPIDCFTAIVNDSGIHRSPTAGK